MQERIVHLLKKSDSYLSGEEISRQLDISRAAIWKYIQELKKDGYDIVAVPHLGYKIASGPDKLFAHEVQFDLKTKTLGKKIFFYDTVASTMDEAFRLGMEGTPEGTVVCADGQSKGRGRLGRSWLSPKGKGIYLSIVLRPALLPSEAACLTLLCAVALSEAIKNICGLNSLIKWPNDLLINGKKVAGILTELNAETDRVKFVVVGIGVNVNSSRDSLIVDATSLQVEAKRTILRVELTKEILRMTEEWYLLSQRQGFTPIIKRWKEISFTLNKRVRIADPAGFIEGEAVDMDQDGGLLIRKDSGVIVKKMAGDITQVR